MTIHVHVDTMKAAETLSAICKNFHGEMTLRSEKYCIDPEAWDCATPNQEFDANPDVRDWEEDDFDFDFLDFDEDAVDKPPEFSDDLAYLFLDDTPQSILLTFGNYTADYDHKRQNRDCQCGRHGGGVGQAGSTCLLLPQDRRRHHPV